MNRSLSLLLIFGICLSSSAVLAEEKVARQKEDKQHIRSWNRFAERLLQLHKYRLSTHDTRTTERTGGYGGAHAQSDYYNEISYFDKKTGLLLSRIQWETANPDTPHVIEVNVYNNDNRLAADYLVAWLPGYRNAPVQTLINLHNSGDDLHAFRQFDASGELIYEHCEGNHFGKKVDISVDEEDLSPFSRSKPEIMSTEAYTECFGILPGSADAYLNPLATLPLAAQKKFMSSIDTLDSVEGIEFRIKQLGEEISVQAKRAELYVERGDLLFRLQQFDQATSDYSMAISLDESLDQAWYGRGMARGRNGQLAEGIADLDVYIKRNPQSSLAYTKRGVRKIWHGNPASAEKDLRQAIKLDQSNAEAHDDLAVILAQRHEYDKAVSHLQQTIKYDPSYHKGFHNLATVYFITGQYANALSTVNRGLALDPRSRDSLLLKGEILKKLGNKAAAKKIIEEAEFLPEGNWSESTTIK